MNSMLASRDSGGESPHFHWAGAQSGLKASAMVRRAVWGFAALSAAWSMQSVRTAPAQQAYIKAANTRSNDYFGHNIAISGNTMVIGAWGESSNATGVNGNQTNNSALQAGAAYVFVRSGTNWIQEAYLKASNTETRDDFGSSVAISGDTVVVGAPNEDSGANGVNGAQADNSAIHSGAAYVFVRSGTNWSQQAYLKASNSDGQDTFGWSVAISGETIVIGAYDEASNATGVNGSQSDNSAYGAGAAYVFVRSGTNWSQQAYLKASNSAADDRFGFSVGISGNTAIVGAYREDSNAANVNGNQSDNSSSNSGAAYVFVRSGTTWTQQAYLKASNPGTNDLFAYSVAISGDTVVLGAPQESSISTGVNGNQTNNGSPNSGAAYVFVRNGAQWSQQAYLKASNTGTNDWFGQRVAASGDTVVIGAFFEDSGASGVNGNQSDNSVTNSGAAYLFVRKDTVWSQQAYLKASNPGSEDRFGWSVGISGETLVLGAHFEDSSTIGVNGNQANNSAPDAGAAYVFTGVGIGPRLAVVTDGSGGQSLRFTGASDVTYRLQRAPTVSGPWETLATLIAPASGLLHFEDTTAPPGQAFYRTVQP